MALHFFSGRGRTGANGAYVVRRNAIQSFVNRHGYLSLPTIEVRERLKPRHKQVLFYCLTSGTKFITASANFKSGVDADGDVCVDITQFDVIYRQHGVYATEEE